MESIQIVDPEAIANLRALSPEDGDLFVREILGIFLEDTPKRITELHTSRSTGDSTSFVRAAHSIKGSSSNVGAQELRLVAEKLEHHARHCGIDAEAEALVAELEAAYIRTQAEMDKLLV